MGRYTNSFVNGRSGADALAERESLVPAEIDWEASGLSRTASAAVAILACLCQIDPVIAQEGPFKFELSPFAGYRFGGEFEEEGSDRTFELNESNAHGIILNIREKSNTQWEVLYARQSTSVDTQLPLANEPIPDLDLEYLHFGGTYLSGADGTRPFLAATIGLSRFDPEPSGSGTETYFSASIGGGVQLRATRRLGFRLEGRVFTTFVDNDSEILCRSGGATNFCAIRVEGSTFTQWEVRAGLVFRFLPQGD